MPHKTNSTDPGHEPTALTDAELLKIAEKIHARLAESFGTARKWFWTALGAALGSAMTAGILKVVSLMIDKHFK